MPAITVRATGPTLDRLVDQVARDTRAARRQVGKAVASAGMKAGNKGAPRFYGRRMRVRSRIHASTGRTSVELYGSPAGGWAIAESGARPHDIEPRRARALHFAGLFSANVDHPGTGGRRAWTAAGARIEPAVAKVIADTYDKALT